MDQRTLVAKVVPDPSQMEAILAIDQADIEFVQADQDVEMLVRELPAVLHASVTRKVSPTKMMEVPKQLSSRNGGDLVTRVDADGKDVPESTTYLVSVPLDNDDHTIVSGSTGKAKILTGTQTLGQRVWRAVKRTFQFDL